MKIRHIACLMVFVLCSPLVSTVSAAEGQVPTPEILGNSPIPFVLQKGITVISGNNPDGFNSNWYAFQSLPGAQFNPGGEGLMTNIQSNQGHGVMTFGISLFSDPNGRTAVSPDFAVYLNSSATNTIIPINFWNATSFDNATTDITYVGGVATFNNTFTFHDINLTTYGNGLSNVTISFIQQFAIDWTQVTVKMATIVDFTNTRLFNATTQSELGAGAQFSLNLVYTVGLTNMTASNLVGHPVTLAPTDVTATGVYFVGDSGTSYAYNITDMTFGDAYTEYQGTTPVPSLAAATHFQPVPASSAVLCFQSFPDLIYKTTTSIVSDPTSNTYFPDGSKDEWVIYVTIGAIVAGGVVVVVLVVRKRKQGVARPAG